MDERELGAFLTSGKRYGVIATTAKDGAPEAALVGLAVASNLEIIFDTFDTSRKVENLRHEKRAAAVILCEGEVSVQCDGIARLLVGSDLEHCKAAYFSVWPDGVERENWPGIAYVAIRPLWMRYSDFGKSPPEVAEFRF
jgi:Pyridoxamine 5'-phosphate oxidase